MLPVNSYSQPRSQGLREGGKIEEPWEQGCQTREDCVTRRKDNV